MVVVGAGIVGLATARSLIARGYRVDIIEKETRVASHQTGRNSGVMHTGVYYLPGSAKARHCADGLVRMRAFCDEHDIAWRACGKVIVATGAGELDALARLHERAVANGVRVERVGAERLGELEPNVEGVAALHVPDAAIVDYGAVARALAAELEASGATLHLGRPLRVLAADPLCVDLGGEAVEPDLLVNCAGLFSDRVARSLGAETPAQIVPFRGDYFALTPDAESLCSMLVYPVPDPAFPFLGVHFTPQIGGGVTVGPNAVLAFAREGYTLSTVHPADLWETLRYPGFRRLAAKHWKEGVAEMWRSANRAAFARAAARLIPSLKPEQLVRAASGVRAQALLPSGALADDFLFVDSESAMHVCNAPSPAATSSLSLGEHIAARAEARLSRHNDHRLSP